jgi:hypothetical protein
MRYLYVKYQHPIPNSSKDIAQVKVFSSSDCPLSSVLVRPSVHLSVCPSVNFYIFDFYKTAGPILTRLGTNHPWVKGIQVCSKEGDNPSPREENSERVKIQ